MTRCDKSDTRLAALYPTAGTGVLGKDTRPRPTRDEANPCKSRIALVMPVGVECSEYDVLRTAHRTGIVGARHAQ
jgi:hypothetical protein